MRRVKEIHQTLWQQQMPDSDGYLSVCLLPASWWLELIQQWGWSEPKLMLSLIESHCPRVKSCFFLPLISIYVQAALPSFPCFTPPSPNFSSFYPKRKTHKAMMFLLLRPYSLSLQVVTSLLGPVLTVCIVYFPVLHSSQWDCDLLKFFQINKVRSSMRQWHPTHEEQSVRHYFKHQIKIPVYDAVPLPHPFST